MKSPRSFASVVSLAVLAACGGGGGGGGGGGVGAPSNLAYSADPASYRMGTGAIAPNSPSYDGGDPTDYAVTPALPSGLSMSPTTGVISGTPAQTFPSGDFTVTASNASGSTQTTISLQVTPPLPTNVVSLEPGFEVELFLSGVAKPDKLCFTPDGRLLFTELQTGNVRVVTGGTLQTTPFATLPVLTGAEQGALGICVAPDYATSGHVFVFASTPADMSQPNRNRVVRFTATTVSGDLVASGAPTVIVDDLPIAGTHNSGNVLFGPDGKLYVSLGDVAVPNLAQTDGSPAGRILRYEPDGSIPTDNPISGDPEWCRGLRNTFDFTFHPTTGGCFGSENGPNTDDELNYLRAGKNFAWPSLPAGTPASQVGFRVQLWPTVIAPTGLAFYTGGGFGAAYENNLFLGGYDQADVRRLVLSGAAYTDLDAELNFARFNNSGSSDHKVLDVAVGPDGALYVSSFVEIWRIRKYP